MGLELVAALFLIAAVLVPGAIIVLFLQLAGVRRRLALAEQALAALQGPDGAGEGLSGSDAPAPDRPAAEGYPTAAPVADPDPSGPRRAPPPVPVRDGAGPGNGPERAPAAPAGPGPVALALAWLRANWVYAVSAASLALAGVFFVQYGVEAGLLPPAARVVAGGLFGLGLIGAGEALRRRHGDRTAQEYLPEVFSGAGIVSVFAAVLAARLMYGLIGPELAFAALVAVSAGAVLLGWRNGPLLVAVGLLGASAAPLLVGGGAEPAPWLYAHYALVAAIGLAVDAFRRWGWVSVLALVLGYGGAGMMHLAGAGAAGWAAYLAALPLLAAILPGKALFPEHPGPAALPALWQALRRRPRHAAGRPTMPVRLAFAAMAVSTLGLVQLGTGPATPALLALALLGALALTFLTWADRAGGLADLPFLPAVGGLVVIGLAGWLGWPMATEFAVQTVAARIPESAPPRHVSAIMVGAALVSLAFARAALAARPGPRATALGLGAALTAPMAAAGFEMLWGPAQVMGRYPWALHALALAAGMTWLAQRFAAADAPDLRRAAHATMAALALIALALFVLTTKAALTLALGVLVAVAAALDRRFRLPEMGVFMQIGVAVLTWRLLIDPGLDWAMVAQPGQVGLAFGGAIAMMLAARWLILPLSRPATQAAVEAAAMVFAALALNVATARLLDGGFVSETHWKHGLQALPWLLVALSQAALAGQGRAVERASHVPTGDGTASRPPRPGAVVVARWVLALVAAATAAAHLLFGLTFANPLFWRVADWSRGLVIGPPVFDSLLLAYGVPGLLLLGAALWRRGQGVPGLGRWTRRLCLASGTALVTVYVGLEIRRFWQGDYLGSDGVLQGELYSYTIAMLLTGAALFWQALARRSVALRRAALAVIGLTAMKVFLVDIAGLSGLVRVASFLGLGLSLAALAWLNRWAETATGGPTQDRPDPEPEGPETPGAL